MDDLLCPHQPSLEMLHAHRTLRIIHIVKPARRKDGLVLEVGLRYGDGLDRLVLKPQQAAPGHVLDREERSRRGSLEVEVAVGHENPPSRLDHPREDALDGIGRHVTQVLWSTLAFDERVAIAQ